MILSPVWDRGAADESGWTAIDPTNDNIIYSDARFGEEVCKSTNRGVSNSTCWCFHTQCVGNGAWNSPFVLSPANTSILYFSDQQVFKSTNSGSSWSATGAALDGNPALSMAIARTSPDTVFVGMAPMVARAHVFRTINGGGSWTDVTGTLPDRYPLDLAVDPNDSRVVY